MLPQLHKGLKFEQKILNLLRFQTYRIAFTADIEKVFLMHEDDRDVLWFHWVDDLSNDAPNIRTLRFKVLDVSSRPF